MVGEDSGVLLVKIVARCSIPLIRGEDNVFYNILKELPLHHPLGDYPLFGENTQEVDAGSIGG